MLGLKLILGSSKGGHRNEYDIQEEYNAQQLLKQAFNWYFDL